MAENRPEMPHTQTSAPVEPAHTTEDAGRPVAPAQDDGAAVPRHASDPSDVRGDRMPAGADEPGAGI